MLAPGSLVEVFGLTGRPELNGAHGRVRSEITGGRATVEMLSGESVRIRLDNLQAPHRSAANFTPSNEWRRTKFLMLAHHHLRDFWSEHARGFAAWWADMSSEQREALLIELCPDMPRNMLFEENLAPDYCVEVLMKESCACAKDDGPCSHFEPLRLLHDIGYMATHDVWDVLGNFDTVSDLYLVRDLQKRGALLSPSRIYGPYGSVLLNDASQIYRLPCPLTDTSMERVRLLVEQNELVPAHVFAAACGRRMLMYMMAISMCDAYEEHKLQRPSKSTIGRLQGMDGRVVPNIRTLDVFVGPSSCNSPPWLPKSHVAVSADESSQTIAALLQQLETSTTSLSAGASQRDAVTTQVEQLSARRNGTFCDHCGVLAKESGVKLQSCARCALAFYCSKECQRAAWKAHKPVCRRALPTTPLDLPSATSEVACSLSPCDSMGVFCLSAVYKGPHVTAATTASIRLGYGIEQVETITSTESSSHRSEVVWTKPIAELLQDLHTHDDNPVGCRFAAACHISVSMALDILDRAERDRKQRGKTNGKQADVDEFCNVLSAALGDCGREPSALSSWHRAPLSKSIVLKLLRAIGSIEEQRKLFNGTVEMQIDEFLTHLEHCIFRHYQQDTMPSFDVTAELRALVARHQIEERHNDLNIVLENLDSLDRHSSGGVRTRYKKIFEHQAAWLLAVSDNGYIGASSGLDRTLSDPERMQLIADVSTALYCASVQCGSSAMFSSGLLNSAEASTADALHQRNQHAAGSLVLAFAVRYYRAYGQQIDPNTARSMVGRSQSGHRTDDELDEHEASESVADSRSMPQASDVTNPQHSDMFMPYSVFTIPVGVPGWPPPLGRAGVNGADAEGFSKGVPDVMNLPDAPWCSPDLLPLTWHRAEAHGVTLRIKSPFEDKDAPKIQQQRALDASTAADAREAARNAIAQPHKDVNDTELGSVCATCGASTALKRCSRRPCCARYCSTDCEMSGWKLGHQKSCSQPLPSPESINDITKLSPIPEAEVAKVLAILREFGAAHGRLCAQGLGVLAQVFVPQGSARDQLPSESIVTRIFDALPVLMRVILAHRLHPAVNVRAGAMFGNMISGLKGAGEGTGSSEEASRRCSLLVRGGALLCCLHGLKNKAEEPMAKFALLSSFNQMALGAPSGFAGDPHYLETQASFDDDTQDAVKVIVTVMRNRTDPSVKGVGVSSLYHLVTTSAMANSPAAHACASRRQQAMAAGAAGVVRHAMRGKSGKFMQFCDTLLSKLNGQ